jgi:hypothetical protein
MLNIIDSFVGLSCPMWKVLLRLARNFDRSSNDAADAELAADGFEPGRLNNFELAFRPGTG